MLNHPRATVAHAQRTAIAFAVPTARMTSPIRHAGVRHNCISLQNYVFEAAKWFFQDLDMCCLCLGSYRLADTNRSKLVWQFNLDDQLQSFNPIPSELHTEH